MQSQNNTNPKPLKDTLGEPAPAPQWPGPLSDEALHGLAGEVVRTISPHTEADPAALLLHLLAAFGNVIGRAPHCIADGARHGANIFVVVVGNTSKGRKGTAWARVRELLFGTQAGWLKERVTTGLSSGEGLIKAVADGRGDRPVDRRLLVIQSEFSSTLKVIEREGNTLSPTIRDAWDSGQLNTMVVKDPQRATGAHISIIGHITVEELRRSLSATERANGFANRFLFVCVRRSKVLPEGGTVPPDRLEALASQIGEVIMFAQTCEEITRDDEARHPPCQ